MSINFATCLFILKNEHKNHKSLLESTAENQTPSLTGYREMKPVSSSYSYSEEKQETGFLVKATR